MDVPSSGVGSQLGGEFLSCGDVLWLSKLESAGVVISVDTEEARGGGGGGEGGAEDCFSCDADSSIGAAAVRVDI